LLCLRRVICLRGSTLVLAVARQQERGWYLFSDLPQRDSNTKCPRGKVRCCKGRGKSARRYKPRERRGEERREEREKINKGTRARRQRESGRHYNHHQICRAREFCRYLVMVTVSPRMHRQSSRRRLYQIQYCTVQSLRSAELSNLRACLVSRTARALGSGEIQIRRSCTIVWWSVVVGGGSNGGGSKYSSK
jgi:hypothetical protein